jgi:hypothetical protein
MCGHSSNAHLKGNTMKKKLALIASIPLVFAGQVMAAVPADVTTATTDMKADAIAIATVFLVAAISLTAFMFMKRAAR